MVRTPLYRLHHQRLPFSDIPHNSFLLSSSTFRTNTTKASWQVTTNKAVEFCQEYGIEFLKTSAKSGENVLPVFEKLIGMVHDRALNAHSKNKQGGSGVGGLKGVGNNNNTSNQNKDHSMGSGSASGGGNNNDGTVELEDENDTANGDGGCMGAGC